MIAVVQRVSRASVEVPVEGYRADIGHGLCVLLGVETADAEGEAAWLAGKLARLRIFNDKMGKMNLSVGDVAGSILLISQFTLPADCARGNRPSFVRAASPVLGERLYEAVARNLREKQGVPVKTGVFGGMMQVELVNDGPVTIILRSRGNEKEPAA